jgi:hypothetical protein
MASHMGRLTSPVTGRGEFVEDSGFAPERGPGLAARLRAWTRFLWADAGVGVFGNLLTTLASCLLAWVLLFPQQKIPTAHELVTFQADYFALSWGVMGHAMFLLVAAAFLADTWRDGRCRRAHAHGDDAHLLPPCRRPMDLPHDVLRVARGAHGDHLGDDGAGKPGNAHPHLGRDRLRRHRALLGGARRAQLSTAPASGAGGGGAAANGRRDAHARRACYAVLAVLYGVALLAELSVAGEKPGEEALELLGPRGLGE